MNSFVEKGLRDPGHGPSRNTCVVGLRKDKGMLAQGVLVSWEIVQCELRSQRERERVQKPESVSGGAGEYESGS